MLEINSVSFSYADNKIFNNLSLEFKPGEITSIVGKSGVGKSTLFALLSGQISAQSGCIKLDETDLTSLSSNHRPIITMFQQESLFPHMTLYENIKFPLVSKYNKHRFKDIDHEQYINQKLDEVNLSGYGDRYPETLSGGQKQRATLARSLAASPKILLLDEPFSALNEDLKYNLNLELREIIKRNNIIALKITHDLHEAINFSDKILYLGDKLNIHFKRSELENLNATPEVIDYFQLGPLTENNNAYYPMARLHEDTMDVAITFKILSSLKRGQVNEYTLSHNDQRLKYFSKNNHQDEITLYTCEDNKIIL
jgi:ABC-type Fe3+/spermidine/putrescine transport system ATPase subunit